MGWVRPQSHTIKIILKKKSVTFSWHVKWCPERNICHVEFLRFTSKGHTQKARRIKPASGESGISEGSFILKLSWWGGGGQRGYRTGRRHWWSGLSRATVMPATTQQTVQVSFAKILRPHTRVLGPDQDCRMQVPENKQQKQKFFPKS